MTTLSRTEIEAWLDEKPVKEPYKMQGHSFKPLNGVGKMYCSRCGLIALRNHATNWCVQHGCNYQDHKSYESAMKKLSHKTKK